MNCSFTQRYFATFNTSLKALLLCLLTLMLGFSLSAQERDELHRGTWQIDTPENGALILIVKRNGLASYFSGDNADRTVYRGNWDSNDSATTLTWEDGSTHRITRDSLGYAIAFQDAAGVEQYTTQAQQVPKEVLGQWAKAPAKPDEQVSDRDKAKGLEPRQCQKHRPTRLMGKARQRTPPDLGHRPLRHPQAKRPRLLL
jgi:hypothetical protein